MMKRNVLLLLAVSAVLLFCISCGKRTEVGDSGETAESLELTLDQLSEYDGQDGSPAYIAVDGVIYDVTDSRMWKNGEHNGFTAGKDLSEEIADVSPHGKSVLSKVPVIGKVVE